MRDEDKARLLAAMRGEGASLPTRAITKTISPEYTRFDTLPCYTQVLIEKAVAEKLGLEQPYYRCHDGLSQEWAVIDGVRLSNFSCYDYLGLNNDERLHKAAADAAKRYGFSASASRLTAGERPPHRALEQALAEAFGVEDALVFVSGHGTNVSTIASLFGPKDVIFSDQASHNSLVLGAQLSQAARFVYPINDMAALRKLLAQHRANFQRALLVTEGLFGMDGVLTRLPELIALKREYSCFLMVDEAHSLGTVGPRGLGVAEHYGVDPKSVDIWMGTLSKTLCGCGGYIAGSKVLTEILRFEAPGFVYSVGMPPMLAAVSRCALACMLEEPWRVERLQENSRYMLSAAQEAGLATGNASGYALVPVLVGNSLTAVLLSKLLMEKGVLALPIIYPGVPEGSARLRFFVSARHTREQIARAIELTRDLLPVARERTENFAG
ncbi:MAG: aminotransferase class I/II-fold pyridoxal phosphate-dependent enzyme [Desulfovibrionaceae bacterium]|nr:aminotransferase class I/II-fold pyridoxal phosphate-dependent enzyme [Desulfovibrionaceae bacterium]